MNRRFQPLCTPKLETRLGTVPAMTTCRPQSSSEPGQRTYAQDRLGEAPMRRTIHPRRRLGPVNPRQPAPLDQRRRAPVERKDVQTGALLWPRPIPSPLYMYKEDLMKLNLQTVSFAADAMRMLNGAKLSVSGLNSTTGVDWLIAAVINFSSTTAFCRFRGTAIKQNNESSEGKTVTRCETELR